MSRMSLKSKILTTVLTVVILVHGQRVAHASR